MTSLQLRAGNPRIRSRPGIETVSAFNARENEPTYTVYHNALSTDNGAHLMAIGWCTEDGWKPGLAEQGVTGHFRLFFENVTGPHLQVLTPSHTTSPFNK